MVRFAIVSQVQCATKAGGYNFLEPSDAVRLRDNARVLYDHQIRRYYLKLLRTLIANRRVRRSSCM